MRVERALAKLLELGLICELGRKQVIGRPILYGTTATFLRCFGLDSLDDLPQLPTTEDEAESLNDEQKSLLRERLEKRQQE
ncbi:SMC-Scp complex subunit ScpB [Mitsuokella multacida]|uniref:SMC-Scp complex subunit ScpB n=1 Tax=Mitsuokella multacida TaxID=52226 RepID=UPI003F5E5FF8